MGSEDEKGQPRWVTVDDVIDLARKLHEAKVQFIIYGGIACILHGFVRATEDLDICVGESPDNIKSALSVLSTWGHGYAKELTLEDVVDNVVVRIGEDFTLDLACRLWKVDWNEAWSRRRIVVIKGVELPFLNRKDLIASKQTYREKDKWDIRELLALPETESGVTASEGST